MNTHTLSGSQIERDLYWCLSCPPLVDESEHESASADLRSLIKSIRQATENTNIQPQILPFFSKLPATRRVGHYYEQLWHFLYAHSQGIGIAAVNHPIRDQNKTLGEIDFLLSGAGGLRHRELAVKFYLAHRPVTDDIQWIGPNGKDRLSRKWQHLTNHQIRLLGSTAGQQWLRDQGLPVPQHAADIQIQGQLFLPFSALTDPEAGKYYIRTAQKPLLYCKPWLGYWCHRRDLSTALDLLKSTHGILESEVRVLSRLHWLAGPDSDLWDTASRPETRSAVAHGASPLLLQFVPWQPGQALPLRLMVVENGWPMF